METKKNTSKKSSTQKLKDYMGHKPHELNANLFVDTSEMDYAYNEIVKIHESKVTRLGNVLHIKLKLHENHFGLVPRGDLHFITADPKIINKTNEYIEKTNTFFVDGGDMLQGAKEGHHSGETHESKINPQEEGKLFSRSLDRIAHKCLGATAGNHDDPEQADRLREVYMSILRVIYEEVHKIPYGPRGLIIEVEMPVMKNNKLVGMETLCVVDLHNWGKGGSKKLDSAEKTYSLGMGLINKYNAKHGTKLIPNLILGNHYHNYADLDKTFEADTYDKNGLVIGSYVKTVHVRCGSTLQHIDSSSFNRGFSNPMRTTFKQLDMYFEPNEKFDPYGINKQPKNVLILNEFPILDKFGEYTTPAKEYMQNRRDYSSEYYEKAKKAYEKTSASELAKIVENNIDSLLK